MKRIFSLVICIAIAVTCVAFTSCDNVSDIVDFIDESAGIQNTIVNNNGGGGNGGGGQSSGSDGVALYKAKVDSLLASAKNGTAVANLGEKNVSQLYRNAFEKVQGSIQYSFKYTSKYEPVDEEEKEYAYSKSYELERNLDKFHFKSDNGGNSNFINGEIWTVDLITYTSSNGAKSKVVGINYRFEEYEDSFKMEMMDIDAYALSKTRLMKSGEVYYAELTFDEYAPSNFDTYEDFYDYYTLKVVFDSNGEFIGCVTENDDYRTSVFACYTINGGPSITAPSDANSYNGDVSLLSKIKDINNDGVQDIIDKLIVMENNIEDSDSDGDVDYQDFLIFDDDDDGIDYWMWDALEAYEALFGKPYGAGNGGGSISTGGNGGNSSTGGNGGSSSSGGNSGTSSGGNNGGTSSGGNGNTVTPPSKYQYGDVNNNKTIDETDEYIGRYYGGDFNNDNVIDFSDMVAKCGSEKEAQQWVDELTARYLSGDLPEYGGDKSEGDGDEGVSYIDDISNDGKVDEFDNHLYEFYKLPDLDDSGKIDYNDFMIFMGSKKEADAQIAERYFKYYEEGSSGGSTSPEGGNSSGDIDADDEEEIGNGSSGEPMEPYNPDVGDVNRDGEIDELDWYILECTGDYIWDFDDDGDIDYTDYVIYFGGEELANEEIDRLEYEYNLEIRDANGDGNIDEIDRYIYIYAGIKDMNNDNVFEYDDILIWFYNDEAQAQAYIEELEQCYERDNREVVLGDVNNDGKTDEIDEFIANIMGLRDYNDDYVFDYSDLVDDYGEMHAEEMISEFESHYKRQNANQNAA